MTSPPIDQMSLPATTGILIVLLRLPLLSGE
jgi:hypothetical protein